MNSNETIVRAELEKTLHQQDDANTVHAIYKWEYNGKIHRKLINGIPDGMCVPADYKSEPSKYSLYNYPPYLDVTVNKRTGSLAKGGITGETIGAVILAGFALLVLVFIAWLFI